MTSGGLQSDHANQAITTRESSLGANNLRPRTRTSSTNARESKNVRSQVERGPWRRSGRGRTRAGRQRRRRRVRMEVAVVLAAEYGQPEGIRALRRERQGEVGRADRNRDPP